MEKVKPLDEMFTKYSQLNVGRIVKTIMIYYRCKHAGEERRTQARHILSEIIYDPL